MLPLTLRKKDSRHVLRQLALGALLALVLPALSGCGIDALNANAASLPPVAQIEPEGGTWKTWLVPSVAALRPAAPPDASASRAELDQLKAMVAQRDAKALESIAYWNTGAPSFRWNDLAINEALKNNLGVPVAYRHLALLHTAMYDALVAAWDAKYTYNRARPSIADASLTTVIANPASPAYPSEYAVVSGAASGVLAYLFPNDAKLFNDLADEAGRSRLLAGVEYPSDVKAGFELGRAIAAKAIERGKSDGFDVQWTGSVPTEPGKWNGTNPAAPLAGTWKPYVLSAGNEFRPGPPPAYDSAQEKTELAELANFARTPKTNADAFFWEYAAGGSRGFQYTLNQVTQKIFEYRLETDPLRAERAYTLVTIAAFDSMVGCFDAKYAYWAIRPFMLDPNFKPLFTTPNHPSYPAAHGCISTGAAQALAYLFPRDAQTFLDAAQQAAESRIWAGIHFRSDVIAGTTLGQKVGSKVVDRARADGSQ